MKSNLFWFIEGQIHFSASWHVKMSFDPHWTDIECSSFKPPQNYLQALTENLPNMQGVVCKTTKSWWKSCWVRGMKWTWYGNSRGNIACSFPPFPLRHKCDVDTLGLLHQKTVARNGLPRRNVEIFSGYQHKLAQKVVPQNGCVCKMDVMYLVPKPCTSTWLLAWTPSLLLNWIHQMLDLLLGWGWTQLGW